MANRESGAILTPSQREWLVDGETPEYERQTRSAVYARLRATIRTDAEPVAAALEKKTLDSEVVVQDMELSELVGGISGLVAVLYLIGDAKSGLDVESVIEKGVQRGKEGQIPAIVEKVERSGLDSLSLIEMLQLRNAKPDEYGEKINRALDLARSDRSGGMIGDKNFEDVFELNDEV